MIGIVDEPDVGWQWDQLHDGVSLVAADAEEQVRAVARMHPDELGLTFDDGYRLVPKLEARGIVFSEAAMAALVEVDDLLKSMSGMRNAALWTADAIGSSEKWAAVRQAAREALALLPPRP
jgi:hypothetical protein